MSTVPAELLGLYGPDEGPRSRRASILFAAVEEFGRLGYTATKWADVADRVGIGQPALYHYFRSKAHCLLTIMRIELERYADRFTEATTGVDDDPPRALRAALANVYDVSDHEALQIRILLSNVAILANPRASRREEVERQHARSMVRRIEDNWTRLLNSGMESGHFPRRDARMLAQAVLGVILSVWRWYRPGVGVSLRDVSDMITGLCLQMVET